MLSCELPQAEGRLRGEVDEARGYHEGARLVSTIALRDATVLS